MLCSYALNPFKEKLNELKVDNDMITTMEKFSGKTTGINIKNNHTQSCSVYVLDKVLQGNIAGLPK